jgi:hypothetical protein
LKKTIAVFCFAIAAGLIVWWLSTGHHMWTTTKEGVDVVTKDEIFGTETHSTKWEEKLTPGLMGSGQLQEPADFIMIGPMAGVLILAGGWLMISGRRKS